MAAKLDFPVVEMSSAVSAIGVKMTCCISTMGVTAAGSSRMYVATSARFSFEISVNIRHGVATKKAKRCSTICAVGPPTFARAAR